MGSRRLTLLAILLSVFMSAMEGTVVATAMPTVIADLGGVAHYGWVSSAYLLAMTVTVPLYGKLADLYGRKAVMSAAIWLFIAGSAASGLAPDVVGLSVARAIQGLGAGGIQPVAITVIGDMYRLEERGRVQGMLGTIWASAAIAGPLLGGLMVHTIGWRWVFGINVPFGLASWAILSRALVEAPRDGRRAALDLAGAGLLVLASSALLVGAGGVQPALMSLAGLALFFAFGRVERHAADPVLPPAALLERRMLVTTVAAALTGVVMMGTLVYLPLYAQGVLGESPTAAGITVGTMLVGWPIASTLTSRLIVRTGFRAPLRVGGAVIFLALGLLYVSIAGERGGLELKGEMFLLGAGMGLATTAAMLAVQSIASYQGRGVVTATNMYARSMGGVLGVGALGAILAHGLGQRLDPERVAALLDLEHRSRGVITDPQASHALGEVFAPMMAVVLAAGALNGLVVLFYPRHDAPRPGA